MTTTRVGVPEIGTMSYNGIPFDGAYRVRVDSENVYDEAQRTVIYVRYVFRVQMILAGPPDNNALLHGPTEDMIEVRGLLNKAGGVFVFQSKGFGVGINTQATDRDVLFGPKPRIMNWHSVGAELAVLVDWECELHMAECLTSLSQVIVAVNYEVSVRIDQAGNTIRSISGYVQIANTATASTILLSPDAFLQTALKCRVPLGFKRDMERQIDKAKLRINFSITDTEIPSTNPYPEQAVYVEAQHRVRWVRQQSAARMLNTLGVRITMRADISPSRAWLIAGQIFLARASKASKDGRLILTDIDITEDVFGRHVEAVFGWQVLGCLRDIVEDCGLWQPLGTDWSRWRASIEDVAQHPQGHARWSLRNSDDVIVNICNPRQVQINDQVIVPKIQPIKMENLANKKPDPEHSYLYYNMGLQYDYDRPVAQQGILQWPDVPQGETDMTKVTLPRFAETGVVYEDVLQEAGAGSYTVTVRGSAKRAGHPIPKPILESVGGVPAKETGGKFYQSVVENLLGVPVYAALWVITYMVSRAPSEPHPLAKPDQCIDPMGGTLPVKNVMTLRSKL